MDAERHERISRWLAVVLAVVFIPAGAIKLIQLRMVEEAFHAWGYTTGFMILIGVVELAAGILVLAPSVTSWAAGLLTLDMVGAFITHLRSAEWALMLAPVAVGAIAVYVGWVCLGRAAGFEPTAHPMRE